MNVIGIVYAENVMEKNVHRFGNCTKIFTRIQIKCVERKWWIDCLRSSSKLPGKTIVKRASIHKCLIICMCPLNDWMILRWNENKSEYSFFFLFLYCSGVQIANQCAQENYHNRLLHKLIAFIKNQCKRLTQNYHSAIFKKNYNKSYK